jgi:hypothetical protein
VILNYDTGLWLAALHFPAAAPGGASDAILYLPDGGKQAGVASGGLDKQLSRGPRLLTLDLPGLGEMRPAAPGPVGIPNAVDTKQAQKALLVARHLVALRAEAILQAVRFLAATGGVHLVCGREAAIAALHAAALEPGVFASLELPVPPAGWAEIVRTPRAADLRYSRSAPDDPGRQAAGGDAMKAGMYFRRDLRGRMPRLRRGAGRRCSPLGRNSNFTASP